MNRVAFTLTLLAIVGSEVTLGGEVHHKTINHDGLKRKFLVVTPENYGGESVPLVLNMHGLTVGADFTRRQSGMDAVADRENFIVAYPEAREFDWFNGDDNVGFVMAMIEEVKKSFSVDERRVYSTGYSQGGSMTYVLGALHPEVFAAYASVEGMRYLESDGLKLLPGDVADAPRIPRPLIHFHGSADRVAPIGGGTGVTGLRFRSLDSHVAPWAEANGCNLDLDSRKVSPSNDVVPADGVTVDLIEYVDCKSYLGFDGVARPLTTAIYRSNSGGHGYPGDENNPSILGPVTLDIEGAEIVWELFSQHVIPALPGRYDGNDTLDVSDIDLLAAAIRSGSTEAWWDLNGDDNADFRDHSFWINNLASSRPGDTDLNGVVDFSDFLKLSASYGREGGWGAGDFDGNGEISFPDFLLLSHNFNASDGSVSTVPEPSSFCLTPLVLLLLNYCRLGRR